LVDYRVGDAGDLRHRFDIVNPDEVRASGYRKGG